MLVELPVVLLVVVNIFGWLIIHLGVAWLVTQFPDRLFRTEGWLYRARPWEYDGRLYEKVFLINAWKKKLPDGAALFKKGFPKRRFISRDPAYLERFARETCRGEIVHWIVFSCSLLFFIWNPWWAGFVMVGYASVANLPCIVVQRYNRIRICRTTARCVR